jgi:hypothetical protein
MVSSQPRQAYRGRRVTRTRTSDGTMQSHRPLSGMSALFGYDRLGSKAAIVRRRQLLRVRLTKRALCLR